MPVFPIALVTGANRGIGFEVCRKLAEEGYRVMLTARDASKARDAAERIGGEARGITTQQLDVTDAASIERAREAIARRFRRLDVLVNNAAIDYDTDQEVLTADLDRVARTLDANTLGPWRVAQACLPLLRRSAHARIVNVSSGAGALASLGDRTPGYSLSKAALNALTIMMAASLEAEGILVNAVCPGWVRTEMGGPNATRSIAEGAASVVWAAVLPDGGPSGGFFRDGKRVEF